MDEINPYAPPTALSEELSPPRIRFEDGRVWRDGPLMVVRSGAALPTRCFVTGKRTTASVDIKQFWPGPLSFTPVFVYDRRRIALSVPISSEVFQLHVRMVNLGFALLIVGVLVAISGFVLGNLHSTPLFLMAGMATAIIGFVLSSRQPVRLKIVRMEADLLVLANIHPDCLAELPEIVDETRRVSEEV